MLALALVFVWRCRRSSFSETRRRSLVFLALMAVQIVIGIAVVLTAAPLGWGILHQGVAILLFGSLIWTKHQLAYPAEERVAAG